MVFPTNPDEFDADERISFSQIAGKHILETVTQDSNGVGVAREFEWDGALRRWTEVLDDAEVERQRQAYAVAGVDENAPAVESRELTKKRKQEVINGETVCTSFSRLLLSLHRPSPTCVPSPHLPRAAALTS